MLKRRQCIQFVGMAAMAGAEGNIGPHRGPHGPHTRAGTPRRLRTKVGAGAAGFIAPPGRGGRYWHHTPINLRDRA